MTIRHALPWQLILADLALILFLVSLAALAGMGTIQAGKPRDGETIAVAPAQALYRPAANVPEIGEWLDDQAIDPRATLSVFARYRTEDKEASWAEARRLAETAQMRGVAVRVVLTPAEQTDVYASLAFDAHK